jgi:DNA-binding CsgD family transcriptional regulator
MRPTLTPRERQVLRMVADAMSDKEIALGLGIELGTVKHHAYNIRNKVGADNRVGMVRWAIQHKLVKL